MCKEGEDEDNEIAYAIDDNKEGREEVEAGLVQESIQRCHTCRQAYIMVKYNVTESKKTLTLVLPKFWNSKICINLSKMQNHTC